TATPPATGWRWPGCWRKKWNNRKLAAPRHLLQATSPTLLFKLTSLPARRPFSNSVVAEVARLPPLPARKSGDFRYTKPHPWGSGGVFRLMAREFSFLGGPVRIGSKKAP